MSWIKRRAGWIGVLLACLALPASASASFLIYVCGNNLCRVNPDGSGKKQLTSNGTSGEGYNSPVLSRAGGRLAFLKGVGGGSLYTADGAAQNQSTSPLVSGALEAHMSPDGSRVMAVVFGFGSQRQMESWAFGQTTTSYDYGLTLTGGWGATDSEIANTYDLSVLPGSLCLLDSTTHICSRTVASAQNATLALPTLSPNGSTLAVQQISQTTGLPSTIALYNYATGAFIKNLTNGTSDQYPAWSPDGKWIAFQRGSAIWKIPATGGAPQEIVAAGKQPTWGGPVDSGSGGACHVPRLVGGSLSQAKVALAGAHCALGTVTRRASARPSGVVLAQSLAAGATHPAGTKVDLVVSR